MTSAEAFAAVALAAVAVMAPLAGMKCMPCVANWSTAPSTATDQKRPWGTYSMRSCTISAIEA